jgi:tetratricopeptide (TPR) repeat protein
MGLLLLLALCCGRFLPAAQTSGTQQKQKLPALEVLERAHAEFVQGDFESARQNYLKILPSFPDNFDILKDLGYCYFVTGPRGYAEAAKYYTRAYVINPRSGEVAEKLSRCYMGLKRFQEAAAIEMKVARLPGAPADSLKRAAEAYDAAGDRSNARQAYIVYLERKPGDLLARCHLARLDGLNKKYDWAAGQYRIVLSSNPNFIPALVGIAQIFSWQGQLNKSIELYDRILRFEPDNSEALSGKAFALLWEKHYRQAHDVFERLYHRYPQDVEAKRGLEESQREIQSNAFAASQESGNVSELLGYYREKAAQNPQDVGALKALTSISADNNHCSQSTAFGEKALEASSGAPAVQLAMARSLRACGNNSEAVSYYLRYLQAHPGSEGVLYELGDTLRRARRFPESLQVFRQLVQSDPGNADAQVGLGQSLAATGQYDAALAQFNQVLDKHSGYYDALQGKAFVRFWKGDFEGARSIFVALEKRNSRDPQNSEALKDIARAEEASHWKALRPAADASPQSWIAFYNKRLASDPKDREAMKGLAYEESQLNQQKAAIQDYRRVLEVYPDDRDTKLELARLLSLDHQYTSAIGLYQQALQQDPEDMTVQASLARVYAWSGQPQKALDNYQHLLSQDPSKTAYLLAAGQMEVQLKNYDAARASLGSLLAMDPANRSARLELARLDTFQGQYDTALKDYDILLKHDPQDPAALLGKARISFYQGELPQAHTAATEAVEKRPDDFSSVFLLASIEHAQHHRRKTLQLLKQAERLSPGDHQVASLRNQVLSESRVTLSTTVAYAREIGPPSQANGRTGLPNEDLRTYTYGTTIGMNLFPRTNSYISFTSVPTDSPPGPLRDSFGNQIPTGITGATAPYDFLYRQSTRFDRRFTVRGGAGFVRFGPGDLESVPGQAALVKGAMQRPVGLAGVSFGLTSKLTLDLDATKSAITYTPVSTRLGVIRDRLQGRINYFFNSQTQFHLAYWYGRYSSEDYTHAVVVSGVSQSYVQADRDQGQGGSIIFNRQVIHSPGFSLDAGYEGYIFGFAGQGRSVFLGFFNPSFYQRHEFVPRIYGSLWGPLGYDFSGGIGIQQTGLGEAITRAWSVSPNLSVRANRHLRLIFGYTYYNTAQSLGPLRGNEVRFGTEWQY